MTTLLPAMLPAVVVVVRGALAVVCTAVGPYHHLEWCPECLASIRELVRRRCDGTELIVVVLLRSDISFVL